MAVAGTPEPTLAPHSAAWRAAVAAFFDAFVCTDPGGPGAPCADAEPLRIPGGPPILRHPLSPSGVLRCRKADEIQCAPFVAHRERVRAARARRMRARGVPRKLWEAAFDSDRQTVALSHAQAYAGPGLEARRALVLAGPTGVGKSYAAAAIIGEIDAPDRWPEWEQPYALFRFWPSIAGAFLSGGERRDEAIREVIETPVLALDDVGAEYVKPGGLVEALFDELVCVREAEERPLILTTNMTVEQMQARLSDRIMDRLAGWASVVMVAGPSLR